MLEISCKLQPSSKANQVDLNYIPPRVWKSFRIQKYESSCQKTIWLCSTSCVACSRKRVLFRFVCQNYMMKKHTETAERLGIRSAYSWARSVQSQCAVESIRFESYIRKPPAGSHMSYDKNYGSLFMYTRVRQIYHASRLIKSLRKRVLFWTT